MLHLKKTVLLPTGIDNGANQRYEDEVLNAFSNQGPHFHLFQTLSTEENKFVFTETNVLARRSRNIQRILLEIDTGMLHDISIEHSSTHVYAMKIFFIVVQIEILIVKVLIHFFVVVDISTEAWEENCQCQDLWWWRRSERYKLERDEKLASTLIGWVNIMEEKRPVRIEVNHFWVFASPNSIPRTIMKKIEMAMKANDSA